MGYLRFQGDVKEMFNNLQRNKIHRAVMTGFYAAQENDRSMRMVRKTCISVQPVVPNAVRWGKVVGWVHFRPKDLSKLVEFDLATSYVTVGDRLYQQINGCPIGGAMSCGYAQVLCWWKTMQKKSLLTPELSGRLQLIRHVDDIYGHIPYKLGDPYSYVEALLLLLSICFFSSIIRSCFVVLMTVGEVRSLVLQVSFFHQ